jgi:hypothetical protein
MRAEGWCRDPYGIHGDRWYSDGQPTSLVRDGGIESRDAPPAGEPPAAPVPLNLTSSDASEMERADEAWVGFFEPDLADQKQARGPWWLAATRFRHGLVPAVLCFGQGVSYLILSLIPPHDATMRVFGVGFLALGAWAAVPAVIVRRRGRNRWRGGRAAP